jgi:hypothetical protein
MSEASRRIAYFSMEMAVDERLPTYSGGLGILAAARTGFDHDARRTAEVTTIPAASPPITELARQIKKHTDSVHTYRLHRAT